MKPRVVEMQIGKKGFADGNILWLENAFKERQNVKVHVLKAAGHTKENVKEIADKIVARLGSNYNYRIIGFVITLKKFRKNQR